jgi:small GTP-binding protein
MASVSIPEFKVILCGEYGVGKTSLFRRYINNSYVETNDLSTLKSRQSTLGMDHFSRKFEVNGLKTIKMQLWDTGGLERVASITNSYYKFAEAALLVFSLDSLESFHCLSQHLLEILSLAENAKIFLIGNKKDLTPHEVQDVDIELFVEQFPKFDGIFKISCKTNEGVHQMFSEITEKLASSNYKNNFDAFKLHDNEIPIADETHGSCCGAK